VSPIASQAQPVFVEAIGILLPRQLLPCRVRWRRLRRFGRGAHHHFLGASRHARVARQNVFFLQLYVLFLQLYVLFLQLHVLFSQLHFFFFLNG